MVNGKKKGGMYENKTYRILKSINPNTKKTLGSGSAKDEGADIVFDPWLVDTKHLKKRPSKNELYAMLDKIYDDKKKFSKKDKSFHELIPCLIVKLNYLQAYVCYDMHIAKKIGNKEKVQKIRVMEYFDDWLKNERRMK
tara:strand:- start:626 stop:1042 length:417 start_codon:yes stop_codon:yes gene_type:complete